MQNECIRLRRMIEIVSVADTSILHSAFYILHFKYRRYL